MSGMHMKIAVADMADDRGDQSGPTMSALVAPTQAARLEIGTQTSVAIRSAPGFSARAAQ